MSSGITSIDNTENIRRNILKLSDSKDKLKEIGHHLRKINELGQLSAAMIQNYPLIKQVSLMYDNFRKTKEIYEQFVDLDKKVERCSYLLDLDLKNDSIDNFLLIYWYIYQLEQFRGKTNNLVQTEGASISTYNLKRYFKKVDDLVEKFESYFWNPISNKYFEYNSEQLVHIYKALSKMTEERRTRFNHMIEDIVAFKVQSSLKIDQSQNLDLNIEDRLANLFAIWQSMMTRVRDVISPSTSDRNQTINWFLQTIHVHIHQNLGYIIKLTIDTKATGNISTLLLWSHQYYESIKGEFNYNGEEFTPYLLHPYQGKLIDLFCQTSKSKLGEWIQNLFENEKQAFVNRTSVPERGPNNHYMAASSIDLIQIYKQLTNSTASTRQPQLLCRIVEEIVVSVQSLKRQVTEMLEGERQEQEREREREKEFYDDHVIMFGNTSLKWATYMQEIPDQIDEANPIDEDTKTIIQKQFKMASDEFVVLAKYCSDVLVRSILRTIRPVLEKLFTPEWYKTDSSLTPSILATFDDYMNEYRNQCEEFLFRKVMVDLLDTYIFEYLRQLKSKSTKIIIDEAPSFFQQDIDSIGEFFRKMELDPRRVQKALDPLCKLTSFIICSKKMLFLEFFAFFKSYPDVNIGYLEELLKRRNDMEKNFLEDLIKTCRHKVKEEKILLVNSSIFGKM